MPELPASPSLRDRLAGRIRDDLKRRTTPPVQLYPGGPNINSGLGLTEYDIAAVALDELRPELNKTEEQQQVIDGAYRERAHLVALLAALNPSVLAPAGDVGEPGWSIVYVYLHGDAASQLSWHISPRDVGLFQHVERVTADDPRAQWDGHSTETKYELIRIATAKLGRR